MRKTVGVIVFLFSILAVAETRIEVPNIIRFKCTPANDLALAYGGGVMSASGTVVVDKSSFENTQLGSSISFQQARVTARVSYNIKGGARVRDLRTTGNIRIWKGVGNKPEVNIFLNPGRITIQVGEILGLTGKHASDAHLTTQYPLDCQSVLF